MTKDEKFKLLMLEEFKQLCDVAEKQGLIIEYNTQMKEALERSER